MRGKNSDTCHGQDIPPVVLCGHVILAKPFEGRFKFPDVHHQPGI